MKLFTFIGSLMIAYFAPLAAHANDTICSGRATYYRYLQADSGIAMMPAVWSIHAEPKGGNVIDYSTNDDAMASFSVDFLNQTGIWSNNNGYDNDSVYIATLILSDKAGIELLRDTVTCRHTQKMLP